MSNLDPEETKKMVEGAIASGLIKAPTKECSSLEIASPQQVTTTAQDVQVTAENADEMAVAQMTIIQWCKNKVADMKAQFLELKGAYEHAVNRKWKSDTLKRHAAIAEKRTDFYQRMLTALEHGYQIVPTFPITAFAIRTDRNSPLRMVTTNWRQPHTQEPQPIPSGEGEYKNPFPLVREKTTSPPTATKSEEKIYWAESWKDLEFPLSMSKPKIMEATTRAMALKIFDDIGILPGYAPNEGTRAPRGDPLIIARIKDPRQTGYQPSRFVSFIVAWHLDTSTI